MSLEESASMEEQQMGGSLQWLRNRNCLYARPTNFGVHDVDGIRHFRRGSRAVPGGVEAMAVGNVKSPLNARGTTEPTRNRG
jgi:hypothetical protein